ncbi:hypothetical protein AN217_13535 [Streptomyces qinglanensis]|uniref:Uncharacterized protein n=1 Tax=Streptomyces qinglanensis TaxID=943816 RepID=A0A1E7K430_9ACTN|nr:hypothetical protein [Streptomyces qinglanensis]OEU98674.1 hypothetical protein AN217_13535 [Streptomyces qinglanensis]OEV23828.1 hypothetical protein AN220_22360 [Streptomyces nanshensis]
MSFEQEWAQHKLTAGQPTSMQLDGAAGRNAGGGRGSGGDGPDLVANDKDLGDIGHIAHGLWERLRKLENHGGEKDLRTTLSDAGIEYSNAGLDLGGGILKVHDNLQTQLATLKEACAHISNHLDYTKASHIKDDNEIITQMKDVRGRSMTASRINEYLR